MLTRTLLPNVRDTTLGSGSKGNSLLLESEQTRILIDAGLSLEEMILRLDRLFMDPADLHAILVTHSHSDHVRSVGQMARRFKIPVYSTAPILAHPTLKKIPQKTAFEAKKKFVLGDLEILPFRLPHDCEPTLGFRIECGKKSYGQVTDLGEVTREVTENLFGCDVLLLEFNHDRKMLLEGPYPFFLKNRVSGPLGHLSNHQSAELLQSLLHGELQHVVLGHLSEKNNSPEIALETAQRVLVREGVGQVTLRVAPQHQVGETILW